MPVSTTSPGSRVITVEMCEIRVGSPNSNWLVRPDWRSSPSTVQVISRSAGSLPSPRRSVSIQGPSGQKESKPLARVHCPSDFCMSRSLTSFPIV